MPLAEYPFSPYYVWLEDRFGLSWQLSYEPDLDVPYSFDICLLFSQDQVGLAQPILDYYKDKLPQARLVACLTMAEVRLRLLLPS